MGTGLRGCRCSVWVPMVFSSGYVAVTRVLGLLFYRVFQSQGFTPCQHYRSYPVPRELNHNFAIGVLMCAFVLVSNTSDDVFDYSVQKS